MGGEEIRIYKLEGSIDDEQSRRALEWSMRKVDVDHAPWTKFWSREGRWFHVAMGLYVLACALLVLASIAWQMSG